MMLVTDYIMKLEI